VCCVAAAAPTSRFVPSTRTPLTRCERSVFTERLRERRAADCFAAGSVALLLAWSGVSSCACWCGSCAASHRSVRGEGERRCWWRQCVWWRAARSRRRRRPPAGGEVRACQHPRCVRSPVTACLLLLPALSLRIATVSRVAGVETAAAAAVSAVERPVHAAPSVMPCVCVAWLVRARRQRSRQGRQARRACWTDVTAPTCPCGHGERCCVVVLSSCRPVVLSSCRPVVLSCCRPVVLSCCRAVVPSCRAVVLSTLLTQWLPGG
jgi:hypothetical protein